MDMPRYSTQLDRPTSLSSTRTSLTPSTSTEPRNSTTAPPRTPSPYLADPPSHNSAKHAKDYGLPSIRIQNNDGDNNDDDGYQDDQGKLKRRKSLERTRTWAEEVERNRKRSERKGKGRSKALGNDQNPYDQSFWSVSTEVIDSLIETLTPSSSEFSHLPSAAQVIAANKRRSYRIDSDSEEDVNYEEWWNENSYKQKDIEERSNNSMRLEVVQSKPRERRKSHCLRKESKSEKQEDSSLTDLIQSIPSQLPLQRLNDHQKLAIIPLLPSPTSPKTPLTPMTPSTPAKSLPQPILSINDIIRKHSPGVMSAENVVKEKARKEIEENRPRLASMQPSVKEQPPVQLKDEDSVIDPYQAQNTGQKRIEAATPVKQYTRGIGHQCKTGGLSGDRKIPFTASSKTDPLSIPSRAHSLREVKPILRQTQSAYSTPQKRASTQTAKSISASGEKVAYNGSSSESLSQDAKITSALLDHLEYLEQTSTIVSKSSTQNFNKRTSFQIMSRAKDNIDKPITPTRSKLWKRKSMPDSTSHTISQASPSKLKAELVSEVENLKFAIYLQSRNLNRVITFARPFPDEPLNISFSEVGKLTGNPVVIFLGLGCVRYLISLFDDIARTFNLRLICIDRWGYGRSTQVSESQRTPTAWADIVSRVLDELGIEKYQILAHSAGSPHAIATALKMKDRILGRVHLLAPWVSTDIDGGYKWLKYIPNTVIKSATAAEWKLQSYLIGKPPPLKHKPISHHDPAPLPGGSSKVDTPSTDEEDTDPPDTSRGRRVSMLKSNNDSYSTGKAQREVMQQPGLVRRASKILYPRSVDHSHGKEEKSIISMGSKYSSESADSRSVDPPSPTQQLRVVAPGGRSKPRISKQATDDNDLCLSEGFDFRSSSPVQLRNKSYITANKTENNSSSTSSLSDYENVDVPTGEGFTTALNQASHAECEPGTTSDLLSIILNRDNRSWGFQYTDYVGGVKVYYGSEDDKISEKSMRWMENSMKNVELVIRQGENHNLMTSLRTMWEVFESLSKEAKGLNKRI
ncbi:uncharacterized protein I206_103280 [Kwoniella pini CBS 10737]|uniref:AB hydrolase-1 domain-containing protein n=1 Tax=Kwoniella pini CBS 10737 TaxID=1296096 RepID=A0A1B9IAI0_9TREE|nr:uncharacterized protein I206_01714 [Kwoniella pini CBS 10737]OCF52424.1 hypothetical protein I206_01714 [Kwoniella pini CBS 10737]